MLTLVVMSGYNNIRSHCCIVGFLSVTSLTGDRRAHAVHRNPPPPPPPPPPSLFLFLVFFTLHIHQNVKVNGSEATGVPMHFYFMQLCSLSVSHRTDRGQCTIFCCAHTEEINQHSSPHPSQLLAKNSDGFQWSRVAVCRRNVNNWIGNDSGRGCLTI